MEPLAFDCPRGQYPNRPQHWPLLRLVSSYMEFQYLSTLTVRRGIAGGSSSKLPGERKMSNAVRFTVKNRNKNLCSYVLLLSCILSLGLAGCSGLVNANGGNPGGPPAALAISGVQAAAPTMSGFQVRWATNVA